MGHGIYFTENEWKMIANSKTIIAHCPTSNAPLKQRGLGSGLFDFKKANRHKVRWSMGSDIGAGPYLSMLDVMRSFVDQNKKNNATFVQALNRSTYESAKLMGHRDRGRIKKDFNANFVCLPLPQFSSAEDAESILKKLIENRSVKRSQYDNMVEKTFFRGNEVYSKS